MRKYLLQRLLDEYDDKHWFFDDKRITWLKQFLFVDPEISKRSPKENIFFSEFVAYLIKNRLGDESIFEESFLKSNDDTAKLFNQFIDNQYHEIFSHGEILMQLRGPDEHKTWHDISENGACFGLVSVASQYVLLRANAQFNDLLKGVRKISQTSTVYLEAQKQKANVKDILELFKLITFFQKHQHKEKIDAQTLASFSLPEFDAVGGINYENECFSGCYTIDEFTTVLRLIRETLDAQALEEKEPLTLPVTFKFTRIKHVTGGGYDPLTKRWLCTRPGMPITEIADDKTFAQTIFAELFANFYYKKRGVFATTISSAGKNMQALNKAVKNFKAQHEWKLLHQITQEKIKIVTADGTTWFQVAAIFDHDLLKALLNFGVDPNQKLSHNLLIEAAVNDNYQAIEILFHKWGNDLDPNVPTVAGTPLIAACQHLRSVKVLLNLWKGKILPDLAYDDLTPLGLAILYDHPAVVRELVAANADVTKTCGGIPPLAIALKKGNPKVIQIIKDECRKLMTLPAANFTFFSDSATPDQPHQPLPEFRITSISSLDNESDDEGDEVEQEINALEQKPSPS